MHLVYLLIFEGCLTDATAIYRAHMKTENLHMKKMKHANLSGNLEPPVPQHFGDQRVINLHLFEFL